MAVEDLFDDEGRGVTYEGRYVPLIGVDGGEGRLVNARGESLALEPPTGPDPDTGHLRVRGHLRIRSPDGHVERHPYCDVALAWSLVTFSEEGDWIVFAAACGEDLLVLGRAPS